jgi:transcriptional regulator
MSSERDAVSSLFVAITAFVIAGCSTDRDELQPNPQPAWSLDNADDEFIDKLLDAIVGFRIDIERIEGKWKLNQNHDAKRRTRVIRALRDSGGEDREWIANLMSHTLED